MSTLGCADPLLDAAEASAEGAHDPGWASFEIPKGVARYRAGVEFNDAEASTIDAFCKRHKS